MLFQTWEFLFFFLILYPVYVISRKSRFSIWWLLAGSYFFYGWWNPAYLSLIIFSTTVDFFVAKALHRWNYRRTALAVSVCVNLGMLGFFKYGNFISENLETLIRVGFPDAHVPRHTFLLPVGISFFVFQSMSYTIDVYRGLLKPEKSFIRYAVFVSFFPQLVAGPIERATHLLPQFQSPRSISWQQISGGFSLILIGLFKKTVLAEILAGYADRVYGSNVNLSTVSGATALLATYAFAWQIYFDFSAYSDIARGLAKTMGFDLMVNFNAPYLATNPSDFWKRWHISLSTWLRDYLYIPLGGNRCSALRNSMNLMIVMLLGGLWHGNTWNFVIWGGIHGIILVAHRFTANLKLWNYIPKFVQQFAFFNLVCVTWVFFRAQTLSQSMEILSRVLFHWQGTVLLPYIAFAVVVLVFVAQIINDHQNWRKVLELRPIRVGFLVLVLVALLLVNSEGASPFIYFQF